MSSMCVLVLTKIHAYLAHMTNVSKLACSLSKYMDEKLALEELPLVQS